MHTGARSSGGDLSNELKGKINILLNEFVKYADVVASSHKLRLATVRSRLPCNILIIFDDENISIIGQIAHGTPTSRYLAQPNKKFSLNDLHSVARYDFGFDNYFIIILSNELLEIAPEERKERVEAIAQRFVAEEVERFNYMVNIIQVSPLFGAANYKLDEKLVFVLMPFNEKRDKVYNSIVKPVIESESLGFVCKRADDIKSNKAIMQDIWKSICEARLIIADLSDLNANVMYELGVAHTVGKDTILLYEKSEDEKFPFDLSHIRRIEYTHEASATKQLETDLLETVQSVLSGKVLQN